MLRPFNPEDLDRNKKQYERISDVIVRPISSASTSAITSITSTTVPLSGKPYNKPFLNELTNLSDELTELIMDNDAVETDEMKKQNEKNDEIERQKEETSFQKEFNTKNQKKDNILTMIFKIVPIGINIVKRGKSLASGFKEMSIGIVDLVKNIAILTAVTGMDTIRFFMELFSYLFKLLLCSVTLILRFPKCVPYYVLELLVYLMIILVISPLFIVDTIFMIKLYLGFSLVEIFLMFLNILEEIDKRIYSMVSVHIIHYPDSIIKKCYACDAMKDTAQFKEASRKLFKDIFIDIPKDIGKPFGKIFTGIGRIFSFLKI